MLTAGTYEGEKNLLGRRDGVGTYVYSNNFFTYEGEWSDGEKHGTGTFFLGDGSLYEGSFVRGEIEGRGTRTWPSGASYSGDFKLGEFNGEGRYQSADGSVYEGLWRKNRRNGRGTLRAADGSIYEGDFSEHRMVGKGTMTYADGVVYAGQWEDNERQGSGRQTWPSGAWYDGEWQKGVMEGVGTFDSGTQEAQRRAYTGEWEAGLPLNLATTLVWKGLLPSPEEQEAAPPAPAEGEAMEPLQLVGGGALPPCSLRCTDAEGEVPKESGRVITATLKRFVAKEEVVVKGGKKPPAAKSPEPDEVREVYSEVVLGSATSVDGVATFDGHIIPKRNAPEEAEEAEADAAYDGEILFAEATPEHPVLTLRPLSIESFPSIPVHVEPAPAEEEGEEGG